MAAAASGRAEIRCSVRGGGAGGWWPRDGGSIWRDREPSFKSGFPIAIGFFDVRKRMEVLVFFTYHGF
jgi:hypothetical protein